MTEPQAALEHLSPFDVKELRLSIQASAMSAIIATHLGDPQFRPEDLDKVLPKDPDLLATILYDARQPLEVRAKVLEVALLRGGSAPYEVLRRMALDDWEPLDPGDMKDMVQYGLGDMSPKKAQAALAYQQMAVMAATGTDTGALFAQLSQSGDWVNHRQPATQLMHVMLQERGAIKTPNDAENWMLSLHPEYRGRAMYHLYDAAASKDIAGGLKLDSVYVEVSGGPITGGANFKYENTHWQQVVTDIDGKITTEVQKAGQTEAYNQGWKDATKRSSGASAAS